MAILGAHMSMAGGYYKAVEAAKRVGCDCVQLFTCDSPRLSDSVGRLTYAARTGAYSASN